MALNEVTPPVVEMVTVAPVEAPVMPTVRVLEVRLTVSAPVSPITPPSTSRPLLPDSWKVGVEAVVSTARLSVPPASSPGTPVRATVPVAWPTTPAVLIVKVVIAPLERVNAAPPAASLAATPVALRVRPEAALPEKVNVPWSDPTVPRSRVPVAVAPW